MPAQSKTDLLAVTEKEFEKFIEVIEKLSPAAALMKREEDTSIKDVIAHRAHWIALFLGWYHDGQAGKEVYFPAKGYKWNDLKRYNADLRARQSDLSFEAALADLKANHSKLVALIASLSDNVVYGGPMPGAKNAWTIGRWAEAAGPSHYRSAAKFIRAALRADARS